MITKRLDGMYEVACPEQDGTDYSTHETLARAREVVTAWARVNHREADYSVLDLNQDPIVTAERTKGISIFDADLRRAIGLSLHRQATEPGASYKMIVQFVKIEDPFLGEGI